MALSRDKQLLVGVVVLAVLGGLVYRKITHGEEGDKPAAKVDLPEIKGSEDVDKISITNGDKGEVVLEKQGDQWMMVKPVSAPANQQNVKSLIENIKELKAKEVIYEKADDALQKENALDPAHALHIVAFKGADKKMDDSFGKSGGRGEMMMVAGKPGVYSATGYSSYLYNREAKDWRNKEIFRFEDANATSMTIANKTGLFSFTKGDKWVGTFKGKPIERLDEEKVKDVLRAFKALNADDFGDGKSIAETGLDAPESTVTINLKDNAGKYVLKVGRPEKAPARYALKEGADTVFVLGNPGVDWTVADVAKFQKPLDGGAAPPKPMDMGGMHGMPGMPPGMSMPQGHP